MGNAKVSKEEVMSAFNLLWEKKGRGVSVTEAARHIFPHKADRNYSPGDYIYNHVYAKVVILKRKGLLVKVGEFKVDKGMSFLYAPADKVALNDPGEPISPPRVITFGEIKEIFREHQVTKRKDLRYHLKVGALVEALSKLDGVLVDNTVFNGVCYLSIKAPPNTYKIGPESLESMFPPAERLPIEEVSPPVAPAEVEKPPPPPIDSPLLETGPHGKDELDQVCAALELLEGKDPTGCSGREVYEILFPMIPAENRSTEGAPYYDRIRSALRHLETIGKVKINVAYHGDRKLFRYTLIHQPPTPTPMAKDHPKIMGTDMITSAVDVPSITEMRESLGALIEDCEGLQDKLGPILAKLMDLEKDFERYAKVATTLHTLRSQLGSI